MKQLISIGYAYDIFTAARIKQDVQRLNPNWKVKVRFHIYRVVEKEAEDE